MIACGDNDQRILMLVRSRSDAATMARVLGRIGSSVVAAPDMGSLCSSADDGVGLIILEEEVVSGGVLQELLRFLEAQPAWSDVPLLILTSPGATSSNSLRLARILEKRGNVTHLERPVRLLSLSSVVQAMLRARRRQYEVRDLLNNERALRAAAESASAAKDHFLATLSHELRTPLNPVLMAAALIERNPHFAPQLLPDLEIIRRNVKLEARLIDDLLDLTRIARGKLELHRESFDLHALLRELVRSAAAEMAAGPAIVLHEEAAESRVWADRARISQVVWNLLRNAGKFTPPEGRIDLRTSNPAERRVRLEVQDTGIGIAPEALARIFQPFEQQDREVTRRFGGLGLGLAIARQLIELHGGAISAESAGLHQGARFAIELAAGVPAALPAPRQGAPAGPRRPARVLLVEDHSATADIMSRLLRELGHEVLTADTLAAARRVAEREELDLLISDLGLPDGHGTALMRELREQRGIPGIAVSGYGSEDDKRLTREAGFVRHLVKPVSFEDLEAALLEVLTPAAADPAATTPRPLGGRHSASTSPQRA